MSARIYAVCNQKGGVGKTATTYHLARAAIRKGRKVLAVDIDPQGNLTGVLVPEGGVSDDDAGLADVLSARAPETIRDVIVPGVWPGLDVVPTTGETLGFVRDELVLAGAGREVRLREALADVVDDYDVILIDCAPALDQLTINALTAAGTDDEAGGAVVVTQSKKFSLDGLALLLRTVESVREYYNPALTIEAIIVNFHEGGTVSGASWIEELREVAGQRGMRVLEPAIGKHVTVNDAMEASTGLDEWGTPLARDLGATYDAYYATLEGARA